jgi:excisionase family DNA binding protein
MWSRLSHTTVYRLIKDGKLQATKVGRKTIIRREAAKALMARE